MQFSITLIALLSASSAVSASPAPIPSPLLAPLTSTLGPIVSAVTSAVGAVVTGLGGISGTVGGAVGSVVAVVEGVCGTNYQCNTTVSGEIENMLVDGSNFTGMASVAGWCNGGHCYGAVKLAGTAPAPFTIMCNAKANVCTGKIAGSVNQTFVNGPQVQLWGWLTPSGYCRNGTCTGSITALGDPAY